MKQILLCIGILLSVLNLKSQELESNCSDATVKIITDNYFVNENNDTSYNVVIDLTLLEDSTISRISYQVLDSVSKVSVTENTFALLGLLPNADMLRNGSCTRNGNNIQLSLGYFETFHRNYKSIFVFNTYDADNKVLGSTMFYF